MGRPIKSKFFGELNQDGFQLLASAILLEGEAAEACTIIKQRGTRKYKCQSIAVPTRILDCVLVDTAPTNVGEMVLAMYDSVAEETLYIRSLHQHVAKTFTNKILGWSKDGLGRYTIGQGGAIALVDAVLGEVFNTAGVITGVEILNGGTGYSVDAEITITGTSTGAALVVGSVDVQGSIQTVAIIDGGADADGFETAAVIR